MDAVKEWDDTGNVLLISITWKKISIAWLTRHHLCICSHFALGTDSQGLPRALSTSHSSWGLMACSSYWYSNVWPQLSQEQPQACWGVGGLQHQLVFPLSWCPRPSCSSVARAAWSLPAHKCRLAWSTWSSISYFSSSCSRSKCQIFPIPSPI